MAFKKHNDELLQKSWVLLASHPVQKEISLLYHMIIMRNKSHTTLLKIENK